jgi:hypothetical protein
VTVNLCSHVHSFSAAIFVCITNLSILQKEGREGGRLV